MPKDYSPRIYVACLASYNNGVLHGAWIDAAQNADDIQAEISAMLRQSRFPNVTVECPDCEGDGTDAVGNECETCEGKGEVPSAEEFAIHDFEDFGKIRIGEYTSIADVAAIAEALEEHGEVFEVAYDHYGDMQAALDASSEDYSGCFSDKEAWAESFLEDTGAFEKVPDMLRTYFDFERYARDCELGGDMLFLDGDEGIHVFHAR